MRTFIAIDIPPTQELQEFLIDLSLNLKGLDVKYTEISNFHITLAFLGEISEYQIKTLCNSLSSIKNNHFELTLNGLGIFKNGHNPHVIWIGIEPNESLTKLWSQVNQSISMLDFKMEERKFSPHLTIGRVKNAAHYRNLAEIVYNYKNSFFGKLSITEFILYQSTLTPQGPIYSPIRKFTLK